MIAGLVQKQNVGFAPRNLKTRFSKERRWKSRFGESDATFLSTREREHDLKSQSAADTERA